MHLPTLSVLCLLLLCVGPAAHAQPAQRSDIAIKGGQPRFWPEAPDQAEVLAATFLGGSHTEWLCAGGFQPDGTVVLAGCSVGPELGLPIRETVLGTDLPKPPPYSPLPVLDRGKPKLTKDGKPVFQKPGWTHPNATGFIVRLSPDLQKILSVTRLPWTSGAITAPVVDPQDGAITIAGRAGSDIGKVSPASETMQVPTDATRKDGACDQTFLARLNPEATRVIWMRTAQGKSDSPRLQVRPDGAVIFGSQDLRILDRSGKVLSNVTVPGGIRETTSVNPLDQTIVRGGEHHSGTGREPWRCPILNIHEPDGALRYQLYDWGGPLVGLDTFRLVSDSAVRLVSHDPAGNILFVAWSDGGNSVMNYQPFDLRRPVGFNGMGLNSAGAGVTSFAYIVRLDPRSYEVNGFAFWCSKYGNKANGIGITALAVADDGAVCAAGGSAWGVIQTPNRISAPESEPGGPYIAVLSGDLNRARFVSVIPGAGAALVANDNDWAVATGSQGGKPRALFLAGARAEGDTYGAITPTPVRNAAQARFGGGQSDGYVVVVDLSKGNPPAPNPETAPPARSRFGYQRDGPKIDAKNPPVLPTDGTSFFFSGTTPKFVTVEAEFRDAKGAFWPSFLCGRPVEGSALWKGGALSASVSVSCPTWTQPNGKQDRRVLHPLIEGTSDRPPVQFHLEALGAPKTEEVRDLDRKGNPQVRTVESAEAKGTLQIGSRKVTVAPRVTWQFRAPGRDGAVNGIRMTAWFTVKGGDLGLTGPLASEEIDARISWTGQEGTAPAPAKR